MSVPPKRPWHLPHSIPRCLWYLEHRGLYPGQPPLSVPKKSPPDGQVCAFPHRRPDGDGCLTGNAYPWLPNACHQSSAVCDEVLIGAGRNERNTNNEMSMS